MTEIIAAIVAFVLGYIISALNAKFLSSKLENISNATITEALIRQAINIAYLVIVFFVVNRLNISIFLPLLGAALGLTIPTVMLTVKLVGKISAASQPSEKNGDEK